MKEYDHSKDKLTSATGLSEEDIKEGHMLIGTAIIASGSISKATEAIEEYIERGEREKRIASTVLASSYQVFMKHVIEESGPLAKAFHGDDDDIKSNIIQ